MDKESSMDTAAWLDGTKAADKKGRPVVAYHGTFSDIQEFHPERAGAGFLGLGFYFTDGRLDASSNYANAPKFTQLTKITMDRFDNSGVVMPCFLSMKNPMVVGGKDETRFSGLLLRQFIESFVRARKDFPTIPGSGVSYMAKERFPLEVSKSKIKALTMEDIADLVSRQLALNGGNAMEDSRSKMIMLQQAFIGMGFDGVIYNSVKKRFGEKMENITKDVRHYVVFKPEQIRPALGTDRYIEVAREQAAKEAPPEEETENEQDVFLSGRPSARC